MSSLMGFFMCLFGLHDWEVYGGPVYTLDDSHLQVKICSRCNTIATAHTHIYDIR
jgi:hypothetical protein